LAIFVKNIKMDLFGAKHQGKKCIATQKSGKKVFLEDTRKKIEKCSKSG